MIQKMKKTKHLPKMFTKRSFLYCLALVLSLLIGFSGNSISVNAEGNTTDDASGSTDAEVEVTDFVAYVIYVNRACNTVTVMTVDANGVETPYKAMVCSCGKQGHSTPLGTFQTSDYYTWRLLVDGSYGRYAVRFNRKILFHSVPYLSRTANSLEWDQYNLLGEPASLGCVRLSVEDAKWIYDNCPQGTKVVVYSDAENPGPLGKPSAIKIDGNSNARGWDPTDITIRSPYYDVNSARYQEFNHVAYANRYPDLFAAFGYNKYQLWNHYLTYGMAEGRIIE